MTGSTGEQTPVQMHQKGARKMRHAQKGKSERLSQRKRGKGGRGKGYGARMG